MRPLTKERSKRGGWVQGGTGGWGGGEAGGERGGRGWGWGGACFFTRVGEGAER